MKQTIILEEVIKSELHKKGLNEFFNDNQLTFNNKQYRFIQKIIRFDDDVYEIVTDSFFGGFSFSNQDMDRWFKRAWLARFSSQQIDFQTIERFAQEVIAVTLIHEREMLTLFEKFEQMLANTVHNRNTSQTTGETQNRNINATLPQNEINLDFNTFDMPYADDNQIGKNQENRQSTQENDSERYDPNSFKMLMHLWDGYFEEYQDRCFLKFW